jgi:hypothetical protein
MPLDLPVILRSLATERPIFHSEADMQHSLAWHTRLIHPEAGVRLEIPADFLRQSRASIDMLVRFESQIEYVELKYKTVQCDLRVEGERFKLKRGAAKDQGSYSFIKDIMRIESFIGDDRTGRGHAILVTNDSSYWTPSQKANPIDPDFHLIQDRVLHGTLTWAAHAGQGSMKGYEEPLVLRGRYRLNWLDYPSQVKLGCPAFRYLHVEIVG